MATTKRRRRHARKKLGLTDTQEWTLLLGQWFGPPAFESEQAMREAWLAHRDALMADDPASWRTSWAAITYDLGGFVPEDNGRIMKAVARLKREGKL